MNAFRPIVFINISLMIIIYLILGLMLELHYIIPPFFFGIGMVNIAIGGAFFVSKDNAFGLSFLLGGTICLLASAVMYYYAHNFLPQPWELIH